MSSQPQTNLVRPRACYVVGGVLVFCLCLAGVVLVLIHINRVPILQNSVILRSHGMCAGFGMMGASMAAIRKFYRALITETTSHRTGGPPSNTAWDLGWVFYYSTRPMLGAVLGALMFTLSFVGFQILATPQSLKISPQGRYMLYAIAFFAGYSVSHVLDRLNAVSKNAFKPQNSRMK